MNPSVRLECLAGLLCVVLANSIELASAQKFGIYTLSMTTPNLVNIFSGDQQNGLLKFVGAVSTGGNGTGVQSQGAIAVFGNFIFAVNPLSNTLSLLEINPQGPTMVKLVGSPVYSQGDYPNTVTASKCPPFPLISSLYQITCYELGSFQFYFFEIDARSVCVANTGANSGIACFTYSSSSGLKFIPSSFRALNLNLTTPPGNHQGPGQISFTPDNKGLVLVVKGRNPPVYLWPVAYVGNSLVLSQSPATSTPNGEDNFAFAFDSSSAFVLADTNPYGNISGLIVVNVDTSGGGSVSFGTPRYLLLPNLHGACWISYGQLTDRFYVSNLGSGIISEIARSGGKLTILNQIVMTNTSLPADQIVLNNFLYVNDLALNQIWVLSLGGPGGGTWIQRVPNLRSTSGLVGYVVQSQAPLVVE